MQQLFQLVLEQIRSIWRFRWTALGMAWLIAIVGWLYVYSLPNQYQASARIHIDTKSAIQPLLSGMTVTPDVSRQVELLIRTVKSGPNLKKIARRTGLDLQANDSAQQQALIDNLRHSIDIDGSGRRTDLYRISYQGTDAKIAHDVVQQTINIMTSMAAKNNSDSYSGKAIEFLQAQVDKSRKQMDQSQRKLSTFKKQHPKLAVSKNGYAGQLNRLNGDISRLKSQIATAKNRREMLQKRAQGGNTTVVSAAESQPVQRIDQQIQQKNNQISQLLTRYTPKHPDVIAAKSDLARLKKKRQKTMARVQANPELRTQATNTGSSARAQIDDVDLKIDTLQSRLATKKQALKKLKSGSGQMTDAEAQLTQLSRNYQSDQAQYQKLLSRLNTAQLSQQVQSRNTPVKFQIIDPPEIPAKPSGPNRPILITLALFASLAAGCGFSFFLSQIRPVFINRRTLVETTGLPVLGTISMGRTPTHRLRQRVALSIFAIGVATLVAGYAIAVMFAPLWVTMVPKLNVVQLL